MKKKVLLLILMISCFFVTKVYAEDYYGSVANPDFALEGENYSVSRLDMIGFDTEGTIFEGYDAMYYAFEITIGEEKNEIDYWIDVPALHGADGEEAILFAEITETATDIDDIQVIDGRFEELTESVNTIVVSTYLKPGKYYLIVGIIAPQDNYWAYEPWITYYTYSESYTELEPNNTEDQADLLNRNLMYDASVDGFDFTDFFAVNLDAGKKARVYFEEYEYLADNDIKFFIYDESYVEIFGDVTEKDMSFDLTRNQYYYEFTPTKTRKYYLRMKAGWGEKIYYGIGIYQTGTTSPYMLDVIDSMEENKSEDLLPVYRLYNKFNGEHLYTTDANEAKVLFRNHQWGFEGIGWYSTTEGIAIYRLYNPGLGNHLYTSDANEIKELTTKHGWVKDNNGQPVMYSTGDEDDEPIYRVYNEAMNGMHHLTTDFNEYNALPDYGWKQEGISMYAYWAGNPITTEYYNVSF